jgi:tripartite-type tricarboxylate transporter receptor subunit TctC
VKIPTLFVVHADVPAQNLRELVALAAKDPGKLNYGTAGNGSAGHLAIEYLKLVTGMSLQHVPYKGTGPMLTDLVAGRTQASAAGTPPLLPHIRAGKLRAVAVGTVERLPVLPDVGTVAEQGYPGFETAQWYGLNAPAKTPEPILRRLSEEAAKAMHTKVMQERLQVESAVGVGSTPQDYAAFIAKEQARWKEVIQKANVKAD